MKSSSDRIDEFIKQCLKEKSFFSSCFKVIADCFTPSNLISNEIGNIITINMALYMP